ncbi:NfeD family protein [Streptomyces aidingensis]|uniref:Membrane-bound serine protease (ClpP class) n=1 Tax=Streptomyces aidingensis TaxID=910347 RepID=A0A1I1IUE9_9ACTN|nr:NfeD family protein [Streptomyces aidingensis]SFC39907.1 membrane-bound serine protease (ClpP class) [Streptomyces aidingensis]
MRGPTGPSRPGRPGGGSAPLPPPGGSRPPAARAAARLTALAALAAAAAVALAAVLLPALSGGGTARAQQQQEEEPAAVLLAEVDGTITPVIADYLDSAVQAAEEGGHQALLVELDTPGGLDASMREIIQDFLDARVPVIVHVTPSGARAASAGALITFSAHVAAMAPGTTIGAATPVDLQGGEISDKVLNDAAAYAEAIAGERGRNAEFAAQTVRDGRSVTAATALELNAVDLVAGDRAGLLDELDGREIPVAGGGPPAVLHTADAPVTEHPMGFFSALLQSLADPNLAFLFLSVGALALLYELAVPGIGLGGVIGVILLVTGFFALSVLPVHIAGLALLVLAAALLAAELFTPGIGIFAAGGAIALLFGGLFLFEGSMRVSPWVLVPASVLLGAGAAVAGRLAWRARRRRPASGAEAYTGRELTVESVTAPEAGPEGRALLDGAWWRVRHRDGAPMRPGQPARVVGLDGLTLLVETLPDSPGSGGPTDPSAKD